jgi:hypothetical protein
MLITCDGPSHCATLVFNTWAKRLYQVRSQQTRLLSESQTIDEEKSKETLGYQHGSSVNISIEFPVL